MADDKTAAEREAARQSLRTLAESIRNGLPTFPDDAQMLYDISDMIAPTVRRVAPDRETAAHEAFVAGAKSFIRIAWDGPEDEVRIERMWRHHRPALLASGVLGVPTDRPEPVVLVTTPASGGVTTDTIFDPQMAHQRGRSDAEQAADQVRAETLEAVAEDIEVDAHYGQLHWAKWLRSRAAEYRKAAGA